MLKDLFLLSVLNILAAALPHDLSRNGLFSNYTILRTFKNIC